MAQDPNNTSSSNTRTFDKSLNEDVNDFHLPANEWTQARNAINNSITGDLGKLGNEPANLECVSAPYPIIGFIHIIEDKWAVYSTDGTNSAIGLFIESNCGTALPAYQKIVDDTCLGFKLENLIIGVSRPTSTCTFKLYWDDGINPSRNMEIDVETPSRNLYTDVNTTVPYIQLCYDDNFPKSGGIPYPPPPYDPTGCIFCDNTPALDCNKLRLALFIDPICPRVEKGIGGGNLLNGSYFVAMAYAVNGQKLGDWYVSNVQGLFDHNNSATSLDVFIDSVDPDFDELIIAVGLVVNAQTVVRQAGLYSTRQTHFNFDTIFNTWPSIPIEQLPIMTPIVNKSDAMYEVGDYLLRVGPTSKQDFNYQPLANQIVVKWQAVEYDFDYYHKGNNLTGYMRDEVYPFFIQWIYDTGDDSASYHIPGRPAYASDLVPVAGPNAILGNNITWQVFNTATYVAPPPVLAPDGIGQIVAEGFMGYWESSEFYPDKTPQIWNASAHPWSAVTSLPYSGTVAGIASWDLCGKPIRHHKFPEDNVGANAVLNNNGGTKIRIMGVAFENIKAPRDNDGDLIPGVIGYRILRGSRNGNKTIIAKGIINNMHKYIAQDEKGNAIPGAKPILYPNYPYNDLRDDPFLSTTPTRTAPCLTSSGGINNYNPMPGSDFLSDYFTFHSPETNFSNPFLATKELRIYGNVWGDVVGKFDLSEKHPQEKLITDFSFIIAAIGGIGLAVLANNGERRVNRRQPTYQGMSYQETWSKDNTYNLKDQGTNNFNGTSGPTTATGTLVYFASFTIPTIPFGGSGSYGGSITGSTTLSTPQLVGAAAQSSPTPADSTLIATATTTINTANTLYRTEMGALFYPFLGAVFSNVGPAALTNPDASWGQALTTGRAAAATTDAYATAEEKIDQADGQIQRTPLFFRAIAFLPTFLNYFTDGTDSFIRLIRAMIRYRDFAVRYHSHGAYNQFVPRQAGMTFRSELNNQQYINPEILEFDTSFRINNLYRQRTVALNTAAPIINPLVSDFTRYTANGLSASGPSTAGFAAPVPTTIEELCNTLLTGSRTTDGIAGQTCSSWYAALKVRIDNQYGQLNNIVQIPVSPCYTEVQFTAGTAFPAGAIAAGKGDKTTVLFGGDIYINRYTEKNTFLFFYDWLYGQPNGAQFNYQQHQMLPYPRYWANFNQFQTSDFTSSFMAWITVTPGFNWASVVTPSDFYALDGPACQTFWTSLATTFQFDKRGFFYLFNCGVRDFFVESEINVGYRDFGEILAQRFYDPYSGGDTKDLFSTDIIKSGNYYKYDKSLSISQLFLNYASWASNQATTYDPYIAETCFVYKPKRLIYSLPAQFEGLKDGWKIFLPNNYKDFVNQVTCVKPVNKSGAMIFFDAASPVQFQGTDQLQTTLGTKLTIGDGELFSQPMQSVVNVDTSLEYGSCQNRLSVVNTPAGLFWMSQNQGKVFSLASGVKELSNINLKWWFAQYLPYRLTQSFPNFSLLDNPVIGIGCQAMYNNEDGLIYFCKRDYSLRTDITETLTYIVGTNRFTVVETGAPVVLGDPNFFDDASWTASYDPKTEGWLSYHDWHPTLNMPGKNTFMTVNPFDKRSIWIHNKRCDLYCNYYDVDYPFEVEFMVNTPDVINTLRNVQYIMEAYKYADNCYDRFHELDYNFDEAVIYNTEQVSGLLKLNISPKNDPIGILAYPIVNVTDIDILFSKEENKYRFNQFWDVTDDRGEFFNPTIPGFAQRPIWDTAPNGYVRVLNPVNLNYSKNVFQRKKFRHYTTSVLLRKKISGDKKILTMLANTKDLYSPR